MQCTVTLTYERSVTFEVEAKSAFDAYHDAASGFSYGDLTPVDEGATELELAELKFDDRKIEFSSHLDPGKKDSRGLSCLLFVAHEDDETFRRHRLGADHDLKALIERVVAMPKPQQETP